MVDRTPKPSRKTFRELVAENKAEFNGRFDDGARRPRPRAITASSA